MSDEKKKALLIETKSTGGIGSSVTLKVISICMLLLVLCIPTSMVSSVMREREMSRDSVIYEISQKWGGKQTFSGPFFTVPYRVYFKDKDGNVNFHIQYFHFMPRNLSVKGDAETQIRYRSIYEAVLYNTVLEVSGDFTAPSPENFDIPQENILWDKAVFSVGISDMTGIREHITVKFAGAEYELNPGLKTTMVTSSGGSCIVPLKPGFAKADFSFKVNLNGSESLHFVPLGQETTVELVSPWKSPSFNGAFLPVERTVSEKGFTARWKVLNLNRNFPQFWAGGNYTLSGSSFGLNLMIPADVYQKSIRTAKYDLLFIVFTFTAFFFSEVISRKRIHIIQYMLVGLAITMFYMLLLSISEHYGFDWAYLISAAAVTALITFYSGGIIKGRMFTGTVFGTLTILYIYFYTILQAEDHGLIMGTIGLFTVLSIVMCGTRKIDWYDLEGLGAGDDD